MYVWKLRCCEKGGEQRVSRKRIQDRGIYGKPAHLEKENVMGVKNGLPLVLLLVVDAVPVTVDEGLSCD